MLKEINKTPSLYRWMISYLVMLVFVLLASIGLYFYTCDAIVNHQEEIIVIDGETVTSSNEGLKEELLSEYKKEELLQHASQELLVGGERYFITANVSEETGIHYITLTLQQDIEKNAGKIQFYMLLVTIVCIVIGLAVVYFLSIKKHNPVKELLEALGYYDNTQDISEYKWLLEQKKVFREEHERAKEEINSRESILRQQDLYRLISLPFDSRYQKKEELSKDPLFIKENVLVFLFFLRVVGHESIYANMNRNMIRFIMKNIFEELLKGRLTIEIVDMMDHFACIVNTEKSHEECREILEETLDEMTRFMNESMEVQVSYVFGAPKKGVDGVNNSYILAREAASYLKVMPETQYIWYDDIKTRHSIYHYPAEIEQKIINAVCIGNHKTATEWIDEVIDLNYKDREIAQHMKKCLVADMCGTLIKAGEQAGAVEFILQYMDDNPISDEWSGHWNIEILRDYMHKMLNELCEDISNSEVIKRDDKKFGAEVMDYVKENYKNPDLNISITALHFGITPSYLSSLFKEQTGQNLLEYINHIRIEQAKKLLEEDYNLAEICDQTGFRSSGGLIRVFKKETGVTPGQMKKILGQTNKE